MTRRMPDSPLPHLFEKLLSDLLSSLQEDTRNCFFHKVKRRKQGVCRRIGKHFIGRRGLHLTAGKRETMFYQVDSMRK